MEDQQDDHGTRGQSPQRQEEDTPHQEDQQTNNQQETTFEPVDPENFDAKSFFSTLDTLSERLHSDSLHTIDNDFDADELNGMVSSVTVSMENFRNYSMHSQAHLERLREQIKVVKDRMYKKISQNPYEARADERISCEQRDLEAKLQHLNKELARASEELVRAQQATIDTEQAATQAALLAQQSAEEAKAIQEEYEGRKHKEAEQRKIEEQRRAQEERLLQEQEQQEEERRRAEESRRANLRKDEHAGARETWDDWPIFTYRVNSGDFNQGIGCLVRGNSNHFKENMISCELLDPLQSNVQLDENEELVSHIINIKGDEDLKNPSLIIIPHCTSRASAMSREPVIKMDTPSGWVELKSQEVVLDSHKDVKFVQAEFTKMTKMVVVTRFKRDFLLFNKRGGTVHSTVDQRVSFTAPRGCFKQKENFVLQIQPVDHNTIEEIRLKTDQGSSLLTTSAIMAMEWTSKEFASPVIFTIPVPPNPVKAKKAAAMRAAKEAKMKNPHPPPPPADEEELKRKREKAKRTGRGRAQGAGQEEEGEVSNMKTPTRWYMGQYGSNEEDEDDVVCLAVKDQKGKWHIAESIAVTQIRIDLVQFQVNNPSLAQKFVILRLKHTAEPEDGLEIAKLMEQKLTERIVNVILKQRSDNPYEVAVEIALHTKVDKILKQLEEQGFDEGPGMSKEIVLKEGNHLTLDFRANIRSVDEKANLDVIFHSQMNNRLTFELCEVNKFLQKSYHVYRGFVMLCKKDATVCLYQPKKNKKVKKELKESDAPAEEEVEAEEKERMITKYNKTPCAEILVSIPKVRWQDKQEKEENEQLEPPTLKKAPVVLRNREDCINSDTLRQVASELGEEWHSIAGYLNVRKNRLQAILRNSQSKQGSEEDLKYEMLMTWAKKAPKSTNKAKVLSSALHKFGREDLANDVKDMEQNFQRQRKGLD